MIRFWMKWPLRNELAEGEPGGGGAADHGLDIEAVTDQIGADIFGVKPTEEEDDGTNQPTPAPKPEPEPKPPAAPASTAPAAAPAPAAAAPAPAATPAAPAQAPAQPPRFTAEAAPTTWSAAASSQWASIPLSVREEIAKRESDMFRGLELYKGDANVGREMSKAIEPVTAQLRQHNIPPQAFVSNLVRTHMFLADGRIPAETRLEGVNQLLKQYGLTVAAAPKESGTPPYEDPQVKSLQDTVTTLQSKITESEQRTVQRELQERAAELKRFGDDPSHPYFYDVSDEIVLLIKGSGGAMSLQDAYDRAVQLNPVTRAKEIERLQADAVAKAKKDAEAQAAAARKANGARVSSRGHQGGSTAASGSMDDTLSETLAAIQERGKRK